MLKFIQTYPAIVNDSTGAGGLNHVKPSPSDDSIAVETDPLTHRDSISLTSSID